MTFTGDLHERLISGLPQFQIPSLPLSLSLPSSMNFALRDWLGNGKGRKRVLLSEAEDEKELDGDGGGGEGERQIGRKGRRT